MKLCKWLVIAFWLLYIFALAIFLIGTFGWFGQEKDPLSAVYLLPLGLPWNLLLDPLPEVARAGAAALAPAINIAILTVLCRLMARRR